MYDAFFFDAGGRPIAAEDRRLNERISFDARDEEAAIKYAAEHWHAGTWKVFGAASYRLRRSGHGADNWFHVSDGPIS